MDKWLEIMNSSFERGSRVSILTSALERILDEIVDKVSRFMLATLVGQLLNESIIEDSIYLFINNTLSNICIY